MRGSTVQQSENVIKTDSYIENQGLEVDTLVPNSDNKEPVIISLLSDEEQLTPPPKSKRQRELSNIEQESKKKPITQEVKLEHSKVIESSSSSEENWVGIFYSYINY